MTDLQKWLRYIIHYTLGTTYLCYVRDLKLQVEYTLMWMKIFWSQSTTVIQNDYQNRYFQAKGAGVEMKTISETWYRYMWKVESLILEFTRKKQNLNDVLLEKKGSIMNLKFFEEKWLANKFEASDKNKMTRIQNS